MEYLTAVFESLGWFNIVIAMLIMGFAGFTKGAVGFGLPMIVVSGVGSLMSAEIAIAAIILPGFVTNLWQSLRNGIGEAFASLRQFWRLNLVLVVMIYFCAQLVVITPEKTLFLALGSGIVLFGSIQLFGWRPRFPPRLRNPVEVAVALVAGFFGGLAGVWGPPILLYLMALDTPKIEQIRIQGISFLLGSMVLISAHSSSGVLNTVTTSFSALLIIPAMLGMLAGFYVQSQINQLLFRKVTLIVLILAGLNLLRRGIM